MRATVYLDHQATTPCDPRVVEAMLPCFTDAFGNASSTQHDVGRAAAERVAAARRQVAGLIGAEPAEVVFTSGATEADNLAIKGVAEALASRGRHLVTAVTEHKAVLDPCARLEARGFEVTYLAVDAEGRVSPEQVAGALRPDTVLVSLMLGNNEIGALHPIAEIGARCRDRGVLLHTDAAQALAQVDCRVDRLGVDLMSLSAHKAYGPQGVGALYVRRRRPRARLVPRMDGGGHERGRRSGTLNLPGIVGFGAACAVIAAQREDDAARMAGLRDRLLTGLRRAFPDLVVNGSPRHRLPSNLNVSFPDLASEGVLARLEGVAAASGAACSAPGAGGSYVVKALAQALGHDPEAAARRADGSLRLGVGRFTRRDDIDLALDRLIAAVRAERDQPTATAAACGN